MKNHQFRPTIVRPLRQRRRICVGFGFCTLLASCINNEEDLSADSVVTLETTFFTETGDSGAEGSGDEEDEWAPEVDELQSDLDDPSALVPLNNKPPFIALYSSHHAGYNDNFYTVDLAKHQGAMSSYGYSNTGVIGYLEARQQPNTRPFMRLYKGPPQTDHFYTTSDSEAVNAVAQGWVHEGVEGYIYTMQVPGTVPLYRVNRWFNQTSDLMHRYTRSWSEVTTLNTQGWTYDGVAGYVYVSAFPPVTANGWTAGLRCPSDGHCRYGGPLANYRDFYFPHKIVNSTPKPAGTTRQKLTFNFMSPNFFAQDESGHIGIGLHGRANLGTPYVDVTCPSFAESSSCSWLRGLGAILYGGAAFGQQQSSCPTQVCGEAFFVKSLKVRHGASTTPLQNNRTYRMTITVSDNGDLNYTVTDVLTNQTKFFNTWNTQGVYPPESPFPANYTGFFMVAAGDHVHDFTLYITDLQIQWLP